MKRVYTPCAEFCCWLSAAQRWNRSLSDFLMYVTAVRVLPVVHKLCKKNESEQFFFRQRHLMAWAVLHRRHWEHFYPSSLRRSSPADRRIVETWVSAAYKGVHRSELLSSIYLLSNYLSIYLYIFSSIFLSLSHWLCRKPFHVDKHYRTGKTRYMYHIIEKELPTTLGLFYLLHQIQPQSSLINPVQKREYGTSINGECSLEPISNNPCIFFALTCSGPGSRVKGTREV
jgi:hypothetical protein